MAHSWKLESKSPLLLKPLISDFVSVWHRVFKTRHECQQP